jgi:hypothetical protein
MVDSYLSENAFQESKPGSGGLRARLRLAWINNSPKWYAKMVPGQKQVIDKLVELRLDEFQEHLASLDRGDSDLAHDLAELSAQVVQMNRLLESIDQRLARLEAIGTSREEPATSATGEDETAGRS